MFTWICPKCGREVPPAYNDCPDCAAKGQTPPKEVPQEAPLAAAAPPNAYPAAAPPPAHSIAQSLPPLRPTPSRMTLPAWLMTVVSALAFVGVGAGAYFAINFFKKEPAARSNNVAFETPPAAPATQGKSNPLLRQIEVTGLRLTQNKDKKTEVRFVVVNHSGAEIQDLAGTINLQARTAKQGEEPVGVFAFKVPMLGPYESREVTTLVETKLKVYELPDWQNLDHQVQITSPTQ